MQASFARFFQASSTQIGEDVLCEVGKTTAKRCPSGHRVQQSLLAASSTIKRPLSGLPELRRGPTNCCAGRSRLALLWFEVQRVHEGAFPFLAIYDAVDARRHRGMCQHHHRSPLSMWFPWSAYSILWQRRFCPFFMSERTTDS